LKQFGFQFTHFPIGAQKLINNSVSFFLQLLDEKVFSPVRNFQVQILPFQFFDPVIVWNRTAFQTFRILPKASDGFGRLVVFRGPGLFLGNRLFDALRGDEILPFVRIEIAVQWPQLFAGHLQTIMKFPPALNPLRGTRLAWLMPLSWEIVKSAAVAAPTTIEVFLHHRFGARSGQALLKGFLLLLVVCVLSMHGDLQATVPLFPGYLLAYIIIALGHWLTSQSRHAEQTHSYSSGEPWPLWRELPLETTTVQQYLEPALCCLIACLVLLLDVALAHWLFLAAIALFVKEQVRRARLRIRRLDAFDNRAETERLAPRPRAEGEPFVEARPAPPINRRGP